MAETLNRSTATATVTAPLPRSAVNSLGSGPPEASIIWTDPVTGRQGFLVIDRLVRGLASGGLRMRSGCSYDEVRNLAAAMTVKEALHHDPSNHYIPMGGAKGGIDCDPSSDEARGMLARYLWFIRSYLKSHWATGDDLGTTTEVIEELLERMGVDGCIAPIMRVVDDPVAARRRFNEAFSIEVDGIPLPELVGGCGVAEAALTALDRDGIPYSSSTAVIQGFGCMGGATARFLRKAGVRIVGVADANGTVADPNGLPIEAMLRDRTDMGIVNRGKLGNGVTVSGRDDWLDIDADILVPAAVSFAIHERNQHRVRAGYIVEAANLPVTPEAEKMLRVRGVLTIPDVVANSGTNAWWWWVVFGDIDPEPTASFAKVRKSLRALTMETLEQAASMASWPREAALLIADGRYETLKRRQEMR